MKKLLTVLLLLILILAGVFLYRGGHHALLLADKVEEYLDADDGDLAVTLQIQRPGFRSDGESLSPTVEQLSLTADAFWTEYGDRPLFGLTAQGMTAYTDGKNLYLDTGKAYALPELSGLRKTGRELAIGLLLRGRVTKRGDIYTVTMKTDELELSADLTADHTLRAADLTAILPDDTAVCISMTAKPAASHPVPQPVLDAMVRAKMEPPTPLTEPLNILLPALRQLLPLDGDLTLSVECGILNLSETVLFRMDEAQASLERKGVTMELPLAERISGAEPAALALLLLRNGTFTLDGDSASFQIDLSPEATEQLCTSLLPQTENLGIQFGQSQAIVTIQGDSLSTVSLTADGEVPFLIATIPLTFQAELTIH